MIVYQNYEKYDMLVCYIESNENSHDAAELYFNRLVDFISILNLFGIFSIFILDILTEGNLFPIYFLQLKKI